MTNRTIDQDGRVALAAVAVLLRYAAVRADPDAARMRILHTLYLDARRRVARNEALPHKGMTAHKPFRP